MALCGLTTDSSPVGKTRRSPKDVKAAANSPAVTLKKAFHIRTTGGVIGGNKVRMETWRPCRVFV